MLPKEEADLVKDRAVVCKRLNPIKIESIVRGYLTGSGLKDYKQTGYHLWFEITGRVS